ARVDDGHAAGVRDRDVADRLDAEDRAGAHVADGQVPGVVDLDVAGPRGRLQDADLRLERAGRARADAELGVRGQLVGGDVGGADGPVDGAQIDFAERDSGGYGLQAPHRQVG